MQYPLYDTNGKTIFVAEIETGVDESDAIRLHRALQVAKRKQADLAFVNLSNAILDDVDLSDMTLYGANFENSSLRFAKFAGSVLTNATFSNAFGTYADFKNAYLDSACFDGASLAYANFAAAILDNAVFHYSYLQDANFCNAQLRNTEFKHTPFTYTKGIIDGGQRRDGYRFLAVRHDDGIRFAAGCRWFTIKEAYEHWEHKRGGTSLGDETFARLEMMERIARRYGWPIDSH